MKHLSYAIAIILIVGKLGAEYLTPDQFAPYVDEGFDLETIVPKQIGDWQEDTSAVIILPVEEGSLADLIYDQTLTRGYRNSDGDLVMLLLAYGMRQTDRLQIHNPDACYVANGFLILNKSTETMALKGKPVPTENLSTRNRNRFEQVTYWSRIGDSIPRGRVEKQLTKLKLGLRGIVPDGILVRVSSITRDSGKAFILHQQFLNEMINTVPDTYVELFIGELPE